MVLSIMSELNMSNQDYWEEDGFSVVGNPGTASPDTIVFGGSALPGGMGMIIHFDGINAAQPYINYFGGQRIVLSLDLSVPSKPH